jgi:hypothetical protein
MAEQINNPNPSEEIREIGGKKYKVVKTPCTCMCHSSKFEVMHVMACCQDGFKSRLVLIN